MNQDSIHRRLALKSLGAGAVVLHPLLARLSAEAHGKADYQPRRLVFMVESNGLFAHHIQPQGIELPKDRRHSGPIAFTKTNLEKYEVAEAIAPLAPFKNRLTILQGLSGRICEGGTGGHSTNYGGLGCYPGSKGPMDTTIDAALAQTMPGAITHIGLGIHKRPEKTIHYSVSASAPGKPLPIQCRPDLAYKSMFGSVLGGDGRQDFDLRTNILDFMQDDVKRLRASVAGPEREKLDSYLNAFESLADRQVRISGIQDALKTHVPVADKFTSTAETDRLEGQFDLASAALISGLTNAVTIASGGGGQDYISYEGLGLPIDGHEIGHGKGVNGKTPEECRFIIRQFHAKLLADLCSKLQAVPELDGTMLDNTLIVYLSDSGDSHHPGLYHWPVLLIGNWGGRIRSSGHLLDFPHYGAKGHRTLSNLYAALLHAAGKLHDQFGMTDPMLRDLDQSGPLQQIL